MKALNLFLSLALLSGVSFSQPIYSPTEDLRFAQYLIENDQNKNAIYILKNQLAGNNNMDAAIYDSLNYFAGLGYFNLKILDSSLLYFRQVSGGYFYHQAAFYTVFNQAYLKKSNEAKNSLETIKIEKDSMLEKLRNFEYACIALLDRDYQKYNEHSKRFSYAYFSFAEEEKNAKEHFLQLKKIKRKSPLLAGVISSVLPGSGKFYAGYRGQGIASLMTVGVLGISAVESYYRLGARSPQFITFGSLFTIFYIGNIWGSTVSVKIARDHKFREIDDQILFDMHIPLRRIFN